MKCDCKQPGPCTPTPQFATIGDLAAGALERFNETHNCPYCGHFDYEEDDHEFNFKSAWVRYSCCYCDSEWSTSYAEDSTQKQDFDAHIRNPLTHELDEP